MEIRRPFSASRKKAAKSIQRIVLSTFRLPLMRLSVIFLTYKANAGVQPNTGYNLYLPSPQSWRSQQSDCTLGCKCFRRKRKKNLGFKPQKPPNQNYSPPPLTRHTTTSSTCTQCDHVGLSKVPIIRFLYCEHRNMFSTRQNKTSAFDTSWSAEVQFLVPESFTLAGLAHSTVHNFLTSSPFRAVTNLRIAFIHDQHGPAIRESAACRANPDISANGTSEKEEKRSSRSSRSTQARLSSDVNLNDSNIWTGFHSGFRFLQTCQHTKWV